MFKRIIPLLFIPLSVYCYGDSPLQSRRFLANNGGLVNHISPLLVPENSASTIENISLDDRGDLIKRNGATIVVSTSALLGRSTWTVLGGGYHTAASGSNFFAVIVGTDVYRLDTGLTSFTKITGSVSLTLNTTNFAQKTDFNDAAIFCNEIDTPTYVTASGNASTITGQPFSSAKTCATYGNYLLAANTVETLSNFPNRVRWSDINTQNTWPALNYFDVELNDGDKIVALIAYNESVYVFKQRSIYQILITGGVGANAFIARPVARNIGAWAKQSVKVLPNVGIAFLAQNTAYLLNNNGLTPIGDKIQRSFDAIQRSQWANSVAEVYPKKYQYWLSVSTSGSTNTETLVYDYVQNNWTLYDGMSFSMLTQGVNSTGDNILLSGGNTATVWQQDNGTVDQSTSTVGNSISATYTTGQLFTDTIDITKNFKYLYLITAGDHNYNVTLNTYYNLSSAIENTQTIAIGSTSGTYDNAIYDTDVYSSGSNTITRIELNKSARAMQLQFQQTDNLGSFGIVGWTIVYSMEDYRGDY